MGWVYLDQGLGLTTVNNDLKLLKLLNAAGSAISMFAGSINKVPVVPWVEVVLMLRGVEWVMVPWDDSSIRPPSPYSAVAVAVP